VDFNSTEPETRPVIRSKVFCRILAVDARMYNPANSLRNARQPVKFSMPQGVGNMHIERPLRDHLRKENASTALCSGVPPVVSEFFSLMHI